jgi:hypothetical protein
MALVYAVQNGNWSSTSTWNTGSLPTNDDDVYTDGKIVTIDIDLVGQYRPKTLYARSRGTGGTAGGRFEVTTTRQIGESGYPVNIYGPELSGAYYGCIQFMAASPDTLTVYGNVYGGRSGYCYGINNTNTGAIYITGNVTGGSSSCAYGIGNTSTGSIYVTGNVTGGSSYASYGIGNTSTGSIYVTGNVTGSSSNSSAYGIGNTGTGSIYITGNVTGAAAPGIYSHANGTLVVIGDCYADPAPAVFWIGSAAYCEIHGNQYGGTSGAATGSMAVVTYKQAIPQAAQYKIRCVEAGSQPGTYSGNVAWLYGALAGPYGHPAQSDVRYGTTYGPENELTGTCHVPPPQSVAYGVPVDNTTGTAALTPSDIAAAVWNALRADYDDPNTFGAVSEWAGGGGVIDYEAIADAVWDEARNQHTTSGTFGAVSEWSTASSITPEQIWTYTTRTLTAATNITSNGSTIDQTKLANLDAAISTRLAASSYTAPDNASIAAIKAKTDKLTFNDENYVYAIAEIEVSGVQVIVQPLAARVQSPTGDGGIVFCWQNAQLDASWTLENVDLSGDQLAVVLYLETRPDEMVAQYSEGDLTVTYDPGSSSTLVMLSVPDSRVPPPGNYRYLLWDLTLDQVLVSGYVVVRAAPNPT